MRSAVSCPDIGVPHQFFGAYSLYFVSLRGTCNAFPRAGGIAGIAAVRIVVAGKLSRDTPSESRPVQRPVSEHIRGTG